MSSRGQMNYDKDDQEPLDTPVSTPSRPPTAFRATVSESEILTTSRLAQERRTFVRFKADDGGAEGSDEPTIHKSDGIRSEKASTNLNEVIEPHPTLQKRSLPSSTESIPLTASAAITASNSKSNPRKRHRPDSNLDRSYFTAHPPSQALLSTPIDNGPPSPLFFSNSSRNRARPFLPSRFSSSDVEAAMLSRPRDEKRNPSDVTTLKLARGVFNGGSPSRGSFGTPTGPKTPFERFQKTQSISPNESDSSVSSSQLLGQLSIVELLEQDERPTFILDLATDANYQPGQLHIAYSNSALNEHGNLLDLVTGRSGRESPSLAVPTPFLDFKAWVMSFVKGRESLDISLPSFSFANYTWNCYTLRKRLRVFSCQSSPSYQSFKAPSSGPISTASNGVTSSHRGHRNSLIDDGKGSLSNTYGEGSDYFGAAAFKTFQNTSPKTERPSESFDSSSAMIVDHSPQQKKQDSTGSGSSKSNGLTSEVRQRLRTISPNDDGSEMIQDLPSPEIESDNGFFDWTRLPDSAQLPKHIQFTRSVDWSKTSLGPMEEWSDDLRFMCNLLMASPHPAAMYWGDDLVSIYNEAYVLIAGQKHPTLMGQKYREAWHEIWADLEPVFANARITGQSIMKDDDRLFILRSGFLEESYFSWSLIPLIKNDGSINGFYNPAFEKTRRKIAERRMLILREVGEKTAAARDVKVFWSKVLQGLEQTEDDAPMVLLYSVGDDFESDSASVHSSSQLGIRQCVLEGSLGVPDGHHAAPAVMDLKYSDAGFCKHFREAAVTDSPIILEIEKGTLEPELIEGMDWRGFGDPCSSVAILPIHATTGDSFHGFLVIGINPRRPFDDDYNLFIQLLSRQLATSLASVVLFEAEIRRGQKAAQLAAKDKLELSEALRAKAQEAIESETKFARMAELAPVGIFIANSAGGITFCNDTFYEISRHPRKIDGADEWKNSVIEEDREILAEMWSKVVECKEPASAEFRFKTPWHARNGEKGETWALASAFPEKYSDGSLKSVFGSITNISQQKWAEDLQRKRREEAVKLKRQQENFIDITSHEMRNPLSAILQCADEISSSLTEFQASSPGAVVDEIINSNVDAAQTIALCAQHQKRIVDDVLTLSKMDSDLLLITPVDVQPLDVVQKALKMFEGEFENNDISMNFDVDASFHELKADWVRLDPSRLLQVLINLTTNAIKFTHQEAKRTISVRVGASLTRPVSGTGHESVSYVPSRVLDRSDPTERSEWGEGERIYVLFSVTDTGRGLTKDEVKLLFQRFSQASPRTHVQYGGSGLGLFICRELTELQGGAIGVSSESGRGSTFAFFIKGRRSMGLMSPVELPSRHSSQRANKGAGSVLDSSRKSSVDAQQMPPPSSSATTPPSLSRPARHDLSKYHILIVEDNLVNQRVLLRQLKNLKCTVSVANHGAEALEFLQGTTFWKHHGDTIHAKPRLLKRSSSSFSSKGAAADALSSAVSPVLHVVLMDLEMPVMDGLTATRRIRELEREGEFVRHVPVIAVTANARPEQIATAIEAGMDDVISKPFRIVELVPKVEELVQRFRIEGDV